VVEDNVLMHIRVDVVNDFFTCYENDKEKNTVQEVFQKKGIH
jgi:hypothetical protein